jgi:MOSC domain-containing protein YiiM
MTLPRLESVNVGRPRPIEHPHGPTTSAIWKEPVERRLAVRGVNVDGDDQADRTVHGGPDQAVYSYAAEDIEWWEKELGRPLGPGVFGENLTVRGLDVTGALIGERWAIGSVLLEVTAPRIPCWKLAKRMDDPLFVRRFAKAGRPGGYLRIIEEGELGAGDSIEVVARPAHGVTVGLVAHALLSDHSETARLLEAPQLAATWRNWAVEQTGAYSSTK